MGHFWLDTQSHGLRVNLVIQYKQIAVVRHAPCSALQHLEGVPVVDHALALNLQ